MKFTIIKIVYHFVDIIAFIIGIAINVIKFVFIAAIVIESRLIIARRSTNVVKYYIEDTTTKYSKTTTITAK